MTQATTLDCDSEAELTLDLLLGAPQPSELKDGLLQFKLLRSVLNSCRGHLMQINKADKFPMMNTEHQFRLCTDSPAKEANFARNKAKYGSHFLFHGSAFYNWHCILREGLKSMTGTDMASAGASYGAGIYLAENSSTSADYCYTPRYNSAFSKSTFGSRVECIALCEVVKKSFRTQPYCPERGIRVVEDADDVITRYLFVYTSHSIPSLEASMLGDICEKHADTQATQAGILQKMREATKQPNTASVQGSATGCVPSRVIEVTEEVKETASESMEKAAAQAKFPIAQSRRGVKRAQPDDELKEEEEADEDDCNPEANSSDYECDNSYGYSEDELEQKIDWTELNLTGSCRRTESLCS